MFGILELGIEAGIGLGCVYALLALGYNLPLASSGVFNLAQGATVTVGVVGSYVVTTTYPLISPVDFVLMAVAGGVLGGLAERIAVRPFMGTTLHLGEATLVSTL